MSIDVKAAWAGLRKRIAKEFEVLEPLEETPEYKRLMEMVSTMTPEQRAQWAEEIRTKLFQEEQELAKLTLGLSDQIRALVFPKLSAQASLDRIGEYLLWFLPKTTRDALLGDLEEDYPKVLQRFGEQRARRWYAYQVFGSFGEFAASKLKGLMKWGMLGWVAEAIHKIIN